MKNMYGENGVMMNDFMSDSGYSPRARYSPVPTSPYIDADISPRRLLGVQSSASNAFMMPYSLKDAALMTSSESPRIQRSISTRSPPSSSLSSTLEVGGSGFQHSGSYKRKDKWGRSGGVTRSAKSAMWQSNDIDSYRGHIKEMSHDHNGCRALQQCLDVDRQKMIPIIYEEVGDSLTELMMDSFGNYLFQKLLDVSSVEQRREVVGAVCVE